MNVYQITHHSENDPRISLSRDSFRLLAQYGIKRALILFISENSLNYRLSLVTIDLKWEEGRRVKKEYSNPHRYSFFLGPETKTHTPETYLIKKGRVKDFEDLKKRFSIEVVNKDFYTQIAILFTKLAGGERTIGRTKYEEKGSLQLPSTSDDTIKKEFSVRLIGRLIFCWFLKKKTSDKGVSLIPEELLSLMAVTQKPGLYHNILEPLFFETLNKPIKQRKKEYQITPWSQIPFLNGGLFTPEYHDYYQVDQLGTSKYINTLKVPDNWLKELFKVFEIYNFTIDENTPVDVELSIEPEMLGRIFENLLAEINPETGNTARKSTGSYYTPRPIVEYMVDESLKQYLLNKTNLKESEISSLLAYEEEEVDLNESEKDAVLDALDVIKIIDPACGSGAFPMGILQKMLLILQKIDPESKKWLTKKVSQIENTIVREEFQKKIEAENWNYVHKLGIIQDSIYGVDIQPIAVDISKLRFFLSLIVDENVDDSKENRGVDWLPNLEFKFVCANSLIGLPSTLVGSYKKGLQPKLFETVDNITELKKLREEYLRCYGDEKISIEEKFQEIQTEMLSSSLKWLSWGGKDSQTVKLSQWNPFSGESCEWFDPEWMFGIKDGFDIVIANPPYVQLQKNGGKLANLYENCGYQTFKRTGDIYALFYENGIKTLRQGGHLCFITSNKWMRASYGEKLREYFIKHNPMILIDLGPAVFESATVDTNILIIAKVKNKKKLQAITISNINADKLNISAFLQTNGVILSKLSKNAWFIINEAEQKLKEKIEKIGKPLKEWDVNIFYGIKTGYNNAFIIDTTTKERLCKEDPKSAEIIKPILRGRDIKRYGFEWAGLWIIFIPWHFPLNKDLAIEGASKKAELEFKKQYPTIFQYLLQFKEPLSKRNTAETGIRYEWYALQRCAATYYPEFKKEKVVWGNIAYNSSFVLLGKDVFLNAPGNIITSDSINLRYLLGCLNSSIFNYEFQKIGIFLGHAFEWKKQYVEQVHITPCNTENRSIVDKIKSLVDEILELKKSDLIADTTAQERKIDKLVYKLYDLTDEEIEIVENFNNKK